MLVRRPFFGYRSIAPWRDIARLQRRFNRRLAASAFDGPYASFQARFPAANIWTNEDGATVTAELPGFDPADIDISINGDTLTLAGTRPVEELPEDARPYRRERSTGKFNRTFQLSFTVDADQVEAVFENGILNISLPRIEAEKPKKIAVKTA